MPILKHFCKYPGCQQVGNKRWALIPVCEEHRDMISYETMKYYEGRIEAKEREHFNKIRNLTPLGKK